MDEAKYINKKISILVGISMDKNKSKEYFNMRGLINFQFHELGLKHLYNLNKDTYANDSIFYSYRRCVHLNKNTGGRMINIISFT